MNPSPELDSRYCTYNELLSESDVPDNHGWLAFAEGDRSLLKGFSGIVFREVKQIWKQDKAMGLRFRKKENLDQDELRALCVGGAGSGSIASGRNYLYVSAGFLRVAHR